MSRRDEALELLAIGKLDPGVLRFLAAGLAETLGVPCGISPVPLDPQFAFHAGRQQVHSSELLAGMQGRVTGSSWRVLGVTSADLYIPILTFVFGEAQMGGPCAVVSTHRLSQEFYGLAADPELLVERLLKEGVHELGHTLDLTHCDDYSCAMAPSHAVEWIDLKQTQFCAQCQARAFPTRGAGGWRIDPPRPY